jgi:hypothetical protein
MVRPPFHAWTFLGTPGTPLHGPGNVSVTLFDDGLMPPAVEALTLSVYVPGGTSGKVNVSPIGSGNKATIGPLTFNHRCVGVPPANGFVHDSASADPSTRPSRFAGADGGTGTLTTIRISFDGGLHAQPATAWTRM